MTDSVTHRAARAYAEKGIAVFPIVGSGDFKRPATEHGLKDATTDLSIIDGWFGANPGHNVGIATGAPATFVVVDVDGAEGAASLAAMEAAHGALPETPEQTTARGRHICFAYDADRPVRNSQSRHPRHVEKYGPDPRAKIDVRGDGGYIVAAPSMHASGIRYTWHAERRPSKMAFAPMPEWLRAILEWKPPAAEKAKPALTVVPAAPRPAGGKLISSYGEAALRDEVEKIRTSVPGNRNATINTSAFVIGQLVAGGEINESMARAALLDAAMVVSDKPIQYEAEHIERSLSDGMKTPRTAPEPTRRYAPQRPAPAAISTQQEAPFEEPAKIVAIADGKGYTADTAWEREIIRKDDSGAVANRLKNAILFLIHHPDMRGVLGFDEFGRRVVLCKRPLWESEDGTDFEIRELTDTDVVWATGWLETKGVAKPAATIHSACEAAARENRFNPAVDWLCSLKWDGTPRLDTWLNYYLGADDKAYTRTVGRKFLIGAAARVLRPGCKMDTMLILEGPQNLGKSLAAKRLGTFGSVSYFTDELSDLGSKDAAMQLQGRVIVEIAEMNALDRSDVNAIKAWLTRTSDRYRPPYGRTVVEAQRQGVLIGTMNPDGAGYLRDSTGARRFWPVLVTAIDHAGLSDAQPQLWAEAVQAFRQGEPWWLTESEQISDATAEQEERYEEDAWAEQIDTYISTRDKVTTAEILFECINLPSANRNEASKRRVAKHLKHRQWIRFREYITATKASRWVFLRPTDKVTLF